MNLVVMIESFHIFDAFIVLFIITERRINKNFIKRNIIIWNDNPDASSLYMGWLLV